MSFATPLTNTGQRMKDLCLSAQTNIVDSLLSFENRNFFKQDPWMREHNKGGGLSCIFENGSILEKAGINVSAISGELTKDNEITMFKLLLNQMNKPDINLDKATYFATGISLVIHPLNPYIPTTHMNYRYFEMKTTSNNHLWWFGGGADLTPYFMDGESFKHFHETLKKACDQHNPQFYSQFKKKCDNYFYLPHRKEHRGIGGIFFDYLHTESADFYLDLVKNCSDAFIPAYIPLVKNHLNTPFDETDIAWQHYRRGRYVEFNLLHDRGTLFGLKTNGRIESIFMSLPKHVSWVYDESQFKEKHIDLLNVIQTPCDWV